MKQPLSIGEISTLLDIPKSTLRYWDSEGLIDLSRNDANNYREYTLHTLISLSDLVYYRSLNMPLKELKRLKEVTPLELENSLKTLDNKLEEQIDQLHKSKDELKKREANIKCYMALVSNPYQEDKMDFDRIYSFAYDNAKAWALCISDQYSNILYYDKTWNGPEIGMTQCYSKESQLLWEKGESNHRYVTFPLAVEYSNPQRIDFLPHLEKLQSMGYKTDKIFGRYLFSAFVDRHCDFYKGYAEILN
ncbi:MAG: MerR family DNA-binding transcriptional regulator [Lachnotalea sp.]